MLLNNSLPCDARKRLSDFMDRNDANFLNIIHALHEHFTKTKLQSGIYVCYQENVAIAEGYSEDFVGQLGAMGIWKRAFH